MEQINETGNTPTESRSIFSFKGRIKRAEMLITGIVYRVLLTISLANEYLRMKKRWSFVILGL